MPHHKTAIFAASLAALTLSVHAEQQTFQASVTVLDPIEILQSTPMSFGKIVAPNNGNSNTFTAPGGNISGSGNGSYVFGARSAVVDIHGTDGETVNYSFNADGTCSEPGLSFAIIGGGSDVTVPTFVSVDAQLTVASGTAAGAYTCDYTVTANYL